MHFCLILCVSLQSLPFIDEGSHRLSNIYRQVLCWLELTNSLNNSLAVALRAIMWSYDHYKGYNSNKMETDQQQLVMYYAIWVKWYNIE